MFLETIYLNMSSVNVNPQRATWWNFHYLIFFVIVFSLMIISLFESSCTGSYVWLLKEALWQAQVMEGELSP